MQIQLYNRLAAAIKAGETEAAISLATQLLEVMPVGGFGWKRLPFSGDAALDALISKLDRYLTGERIETWQA